MTRFVVALAAFLALVAPPLTHPTATAQEDDPPGTDEPAPTTVTTEAPRPTTTERETTTTTERATTTTTERETTTTTEADDPTTTTTPPPDTTTVPTTAVLPGAGDGDGGDDGDFDVSGAPALLIIGGVLLIGLGALGWYRSRAGA